MDDFVWHEVAVLGFVTGTMTEPKTGEKLLRIFLPTPPNPTSGIVVIIHEKNAIDPGWTIDEALKMVIPGGIIGSDQIHLKK